MDFHTTNVRVGLVQRAAVTAAICIALPLASIACAFATPRMVATGQVVDPAGKSVALGGRPVDLALSPSKRRVYVKDNRGIEVLDTASWTVVQELKFPEGGGSMHGIAVSPDGTQVFATTAQNDLDIAAVAATGELKWQMTIKLPGPGGEGASDPCGILVCAAQGRAYVCLSRNNSIGIVDLTAGRVIAQIPVGIAPFDIVCDQSGRWAYVCDWGGRHPRQGDLTATSSGTPTVVDSRGVAASGCVSVVDLGSGKEVCQIPTGLHPCSLGLTGDGRELYVANANSDTVTVIDTSKRRVCETIPIAPYGLHASGCAPTGMVLAGGGKTLFVSEGGIDATAVVGLPSGTQRASKVVGFIPCGWYPGAVVTDGNHLFIADVKGDGLHRRPPGAKGFNSWQLQGSIDRIPIPSRVELTKFTSQVREYSRLADVRNAQSRSNSRAPICPVPKLVGEASVFKHVVYVIKENRSYDQIFGDVPQGRGDPSLCIYGTDVTPNHHALAEQFVLLDNYHCNGVCSADGHSWATEGNVTDHLEKSFGGFSRSYTFGDDPLTYSSSGFLWDDALRHGLTFRNWGEMDYATAPAGMDYFALLGESIGHRLVSKFRHSIGIARLRRYSDPEYPGWNLGIPDATRADLFLKDLRGDEVRRSFPNLTIIYLPDDHTAGLSSGSPTPRSYIADNDLALGRIVEGISHSPFWPQTCIFVNEDDPQDGFDHVDAYRSLCLVISPYTKRKSVVHQFYNQTSVLHTIEHILGLPPMNQMDSLAPVMYDCFTNKANLQPFSHLANGVPLGERNPKSASLRGVLRHLATLSDSMKWSHPDLNSDDELNQILLQDASNVARARTH